MNTRSRLRACFAFLYCLSLRPASLWADEMNPEEVFFTEIPVVTVASRKAEKISDAPSIVSAITAEQIEKFGYRTIWEALNRLPGVEIVRGPFQRPRILMRGTDEPANQKVLLLLNGAPFEVMAFNTYFFPSSLPPVEHVQAIEVLRGPGSALYGAGGFAGVINIKTKTSKDVNGVEVSSLGGENSSYRTSVLYGKTHGKSGLSVFAHRAEDGGVRQFVPADGQSEFPSALPFPIAPTRTPTRVRDPHDARAAGVNLSHGGFQANGLWYDSNTPEYLAFNVVQTPNRDKTSSYTRFGLRMIDTKWVLDVTPTLQVTPSFTYSWTSVALRGKIFNDFDTPYPPLVPGAYLPDFYGGPHESAKSQNSELYVSWDPVERHSLSGSVGLFRENIYDIHDLSTFDPYVSGPVFPQPTGGFLTYPESFLDQGHRNNYFATGQYRWRVADPLDLLVGARYDRFKGKTTGIDKISYRSLKPRFTALIRPARDTVVKLLYNQAFRAPTIFQITQRGNPVFKGNPDLRPENLETYEIGVSQRLHKMELSANAYHEKVSERLAPREKTGPTDIPEMLNRGRLRNNGLDVEGRFFVNRSLSLTANYSYIDTYDSDTDTSLAAITRHKAYLSSEWSILPILSLNSELLWRGNRQQYKTNPAPYDGKLPSYSLVNVNLVVNPSGHWTVAVGSRNLFNKGYFDPREAIYSTPLIPTRGREVFVSGKLKF